MSAREAVTLIAAGLALTGLGPALVGWALWSLLGDALFDVGAWALLAVVLMLAVALAADLATNGGRR